MSQFDMAFDILSNSKALQDLETLGSEISQRPCGDAPVEGGETTAIFLRQPNEVEIGEVVG